MTNEHHDEHTERKQPAQKPGKLCGQERMQLRWLANRHSAASIVTELAEQQAPGTAEHYTLTICAQQLKRIEQRNRRMEQRNKRSASS